MRAFPILPSSLLLTGSLHAESPVIAPIIIWFATAPENRELPAVFKTVSGKAHPPAMAPRRVVTMARTLAERHDPNDTFPAEITVSLGQE